MAGINLAAEHNFWRLGLFSMPFGSKKPIRVNTSSGDVQLAVPCRMVTAITGSKIVVDINASDGLQTNVSIEPNFPCINIVTVHQTGTDCTDMWAWPME